MLGFFSFTEVTDPSAHRAYNEWHQLDHMPEQFSLDGMLFGQRWVCTPQCRQARVAVSPLLEPCHYMTLYLLRDAGVLPAFKALGGRLRRADRFFGPRAAHLSGPFALQDRWVAPRIKVSEAVVPFRPSRGVYVIVGPAVEGGTLVGRDGVAGAWAFTEGPAQANAEGAQGNAEGDSDRHITVAFVDGDLASVAEDVGRWCLERGEVMEWAGPLRRIDVDSWDWFDRLSHR